MCVCVHVHACVNIPLKLCCVFSCAVVRGSSAWRWCVFCSRRLFGALHSISSSRVSAPGRSVLHTHTHLSRTFAFHHFAISLCEFRKLQPSLASTTETASCFPSSTTMTSGTSSPPSPCLDPSWYARDSTITTLAHASLAGL